jgi:adenylosuccinate synthase
LAESQADVEQKRIGVIRSYLTRHGAGPFIGFAPSVQEHLPEPHNSSESSQGAFRRGPLDLALLRYSLRCCGRVDGLAVTHVDRLPMLPHELTDVDEFAEESTGEDADPPAHLFDPAARSTRQMRTDYVGEFLGELENRLHVPVRYSSAGPTYEDKVARE